MPTCSICNGPIEPHGTWTQGHNAEPVNDGRCCDDCNATVVIPERIAQMVERAEQKRKDPLLNPKRWRQP